MQTFSQRMKEALRLKGLKQSDISRMTGLDKSLISNYLAGKYKAKQDNLYSIAKALNVSEAWLMGYDVPMERESSFDREKEIDLSRFPNIMPIKTKKFPLVGEIACGEPIFANEEYETFIEASADIRADFCLRAKGDSMIGARIHDGDIVFIQKASLVENGQIAAVVIDDVATLKRWYYYREKNKLILNPENPAFEPLVFINEELDHVHCLGRAVYLMSRL